MIKVMNNNPSNGALRIHTRASQPRTSSNLSFQDQFRGGLRAGVDLTNSAVKQVLRPIPGSAALSASLSDAAANLGSASKLDASSAANSNVSLDGDMNSLQDEMVKNNHEMLEQQLRVSQITTSYSTRSYTIKAMFDALKTIGSNIR